jgi:hypothetical protein
VTSTGPVHFIYLGGLWHWQYARAIETARVHGAPVWLWEAAEYTGRLPDDGQFGLPDERIAFDLPDWLRDHPIMLANVKDYYVWKILYEHGGLYLDLDTISLASVWDLLTRDVLVSVEWEPGFDAGHPYNSAVVAARSKSDALSTLEREADYVLRSGTSEWGACGPHLLTEVVGRFPHDFDIAPMPLLNGWRDDTIYRYYDGEPPPDGTRVIHLYQSSRPERFLADRWMP